MLVIIFLDFLMFYQICFSQEVKRRVINRDKECIQELPHELLNDFRNYQENLSISETLKLLENGNGTFPVVRYLT